MYLGNEEERFEDSLGTTEAQQAAEERSAQATGVLVKAFGMFWRGEEVDWERSTPQLLGSQSPGAQEVDFANQNGIYIRL